MGITNNMSIEIWQFGSSMVMFLAALKMFPSHYMKRLN